MRYWKTGNGQNGTQKWLYIPSTKAQTNPARPLPRSIRLKMGTPVHGIALDPNNKSVPVPDRQEHSSQFTPVMPIGILLIYLCQQTMLDASHYYGK
jgi:hypothetical protein